MSSTEIFGLASVAALCLALLLGASLGAQEQGADLAKLAALETEPVSYTHLTLPTICSV